MKNIKVKVQLDEGAAMPTRAHDTDVGYDVKVLHVTLISTHGVKWPVHSDSDFEPKWLEWRDGVISKVMIDTGVHIQPEPGYWVELVPNSRLAKTPFMYANSIGIIDPDYTGSMRVVLNITDPSRFHIYKHYIKPGKTIGQLIIREQISADFEVTDKLDDTDRGDGGFGSTEKKKCGDCRWYSEEHIHGSSFYEYCIFEKQGKITKETKACHTFTKKKTQ